MRDGALYEDGAMIEWISETPPDVSRVSIRKRAFGSKLVVIQVYQDAEDTLKAAAFYHRCINTHSLYPVKYTVSTFRHRIKLIFDCADASLSPIRFLRICQFADSNESTPHFVVRCRQDTIVEK